MPSKVAVDLAKLLKRSKWTQYRLIREAGFSTSTARRLLGHGEASTEAMERAAKLVGMALVLRKAATGRAGASVDKPAIAKD